ncbi:DUF935 family protein [Gluconacetobacter azotocaptans]|uniref:DUF935 domain-containing protein n=1 Tax=Gluconacetobacter azotocaptans TaxID=142834 RepID=UPI00195961BD|nr:DUF935 family protein [Gluconacetobacter azotocaptans]MBM9400370.1 DUF935 family protein [Gluconacetobacter azotocaptans]
MAGLIDQWGNPLKPTVLTQPIATPTIVGMRPAVSGMPEIARLNPARLGSMLAAADQGSSYAWQELAAQIEERDPHYLGVLSTRKRVVSQLPITVTPASEDPNHVKHADFIRDWVKSSVLQPALFDMLDAIGKGYSVLEPEWKLTPGDNRIVNLPFRLQRWFDVSWQDGETILMRSDSQDAAPPLAEGAPPHVGFTAMDPRAFVVHRHASWSGLTIRSGLTRLVAWSWMFKMFTLRDWAVFTQNYGLPMRVGRYGPGASPEDRDVLWRALTDIAGACAAMIPVGMELEFIEPKNGAGSDMLHQRRADWLDSQVSKAVLGQTGTTDSKQGAHASGQVHRLVQEDIERADAAILSATINRQMVQPQVAYTFGPQAGGYPVLSIGRPDEPSLRDLIDAIQWAGPQGFKVRAQDLLDRFNLTPPEEGDAVVGGVVAPPPPVQPPKDLPTRVQPPEDRPGRAPGATVHDAPAQDAPGEKTMHARLGRLVERHVRDNGPAIIDALEAGLARQAGPALGRMTDAIRQQIMAARDMDDLHTRLSRLKLPDRDFAEAMAQGMMVANLAGDVELLEQLEAERRTGHA